MFYVVQYREINRRIDRSSRVTRQFTGPNARARLSSELAAVRKVRLSSELAAVRQMLAKSIAHAAQTISWEVRAS